MHGRYLMHLFSCVKLANISVRRFGCVKIFLIPSIFEMLSDDSNGNEKRNFRKRKINSVCCLLFLQKRRNVERSMEFRCVFSVRKQDVS